MNILICQGHYIRKIITLDLSIPRIDGFKKLLKFDDTYDKQVTELEEKTIVFEQSLRIIIGGTKR